MRLVDTHCHWNEEPLKAPLEEQRAAAAEAGVAWALVVGFDLPSSRRALELTELPGLPRMDAAVGLHPHDARTADAGFDEALRALLGHPRALALGEIGLDYWYDNSPREVQREVFARQAALGVEARKPLVLHLRNGKDPVADGVYAEAFRVLEETGASKVGGVFHCFGGDGDQARAALDLGFHLSFAGPLTYPKNQGLREVARLCPSDRILVETDAPYLAPQAHRGRPNEPSWVVEVARVLAEVRGVPLEALAETLWGNALRLFRPEGLS